MGFAGVAASGSAPVPGYASGHSSFVRTRSVARATGAARFSRGHLLRTSRRTDRSLSFTATRPGNSRNASRRVSVNKRARPLIRLTTW